jgi:hypothetical protein
MAVRNNTFSLKRETRILQIDPRIPQNDPIGYVHLHHSFFYCLVSGGYFEGEENKLEKAFCLIISFVDRARAGLGAIRI